MNLNSRNVDKIQKALQDLQQLSPQQIASLSSQQSLSELRIKRIENLKGNLATKSQSSEHELSADHDYSSQQQNQSQGKRNINSHGVNWGLFKQMPIVSSREAKNNFEAEFTKKLQMYRQHIREEQEKNIQDEPKEQNFVEQLSKQKKQNRKQGGIFLPVLNSQTGPFSFPAQKHTNTFDKPNPIPVNNSSIFSTSTFPNPSKPFESTPWGEMKISELNPPASIGFGNGIFSNKGTLINPIQQKKSIKNKDDQKKTVIQQTPQIQQNKGFIPGNNLGSNNSLFSMKLADVPQVAPPQPIKPASSLFSQNNPLSHIKIDKAPLFNQNIQPPLEAKKQVPHIFDNLLPSAPKVNIFTKSLNVQQPEAPKQIEIDKKGGLFSNSNPWTENQKSNQQSKFSPTIFMSNVVVEKNNEHLFAANKSLPFGEKMIQNINKAPLFSGETKTVSGGGLNNIFNKTTPLSTNLFGSPATPPPADNLFQNVKINTPNPLPFSTITTNKTPLFSHLESQPQSQPQPQNQKQDQDKTIISTPQSQTPPSIFGHSGKSIFGGNELKKQQKYQSGSLFTNNILSQPSQHQTIDNKQPLPKKDPAINIFANPQKATNQQQSKKDTKMQFKLPSKEEQQLKAFPNLGGSLFGQKQQNLGIFGNAKTPFASLQPQKSEQAQKTSIFNLKTVPVQNQKQKIVQISSNPAVQKQNQQQGPADDSSKKSAPKKANELFKDFANSNPENMFNKQGRTLGSINIFKSNVPQSQSIFNKPMKPALGLFANPTKSNIFGNPSTNSIFEKGQKQEQEQQNDEEGEEEAGIQDKQQIDPTKSTGNYKYEESEVKFKQQVLKLKRGDQNIVENVILSIQKFVGSKNHIVGVRFANKCPYFMGSIIYGVSEASKIKENQYKNLAVKKLLFTKDDGKPALENLKIQFKDPKHGAAFFAAFEKVQKKQTD